jgi:polyribonucleotide nucleotidyltransferase
MNKVEKTFKIAQRDVKVSFGHFGFRSDVALMLQEGETVVMAFVTVSSKETQLDYFPLGINYVEKYYAGGKISSSRFIKREGRPSDDAIIKGRIIDRSLRPLFPEGFKREVSVIINVMSYDGIVDPVLLAGNAAAMAVHMSSVPFEGPVGIVRVGVDKDMNLITSPTKEQREASDLDAVISSTKDAITQLEIEGNQISEEVMAQAFDKAFEEAKDWHKIMDELKSEYGKAKLEYSETKAQLELVEKYTKEYGKELEEAMYDDKNRNTKLDAIRNRIVENEKSATDSELQISEGEIQSAIHQVEKNIVREGLLKAKRPSGRKMDEIREIYVEAKVLPRVHGSAMFTRGITQALAITTLGSTRLAQTLENFEGEGEKSFMHHYSGPSYSIGEAGRFSFYPGNREIGHGGLAEKALRPVIPEENEFPYTIRVVSEVLSQNGSSSMASTCGACLSLMDAGVPIKAQVAGISIGLITRDEDQKDFQLMTDVQDVEDFFGDMDFKVAGTPNGITAIQMDTKLKGVKPEILKQGLTQAKSARMIILDKYKEVLSEPRKELSEYAPKVESLKIAVSKIAELIGPGGKNIKKILESVENKIDVDIQDDGNVYITGVEKELLDKVVSQIKAITYEPEIGEMFNASVDRIMPYGVFVESEGGLYGLVHKSEISDKFVDDPAKLFNKGDKVKVKIIGKLEDGKISLSIKQAK